VPLMSAVSYIVLHPALLRQVLQKEVVSLASIVSLLAAL
jgi:hypothetical protein